MLVRIRQHPTCVPPPRPSTAPTVKSVKFCGGRAVESASAAVSEFPRLQNGRFAWNGKKSEGRRSAGRKAAGRGTTVLVGTMAPHPLAADDSGGGLRLQQAEPLLSNGCQLSPHSCRSLDAWEPFVPANVDPAWPWTQDAALDWPSSSSPSTRRQLLLAGFVSPWVWSSSSAPWVEALGVEVTGLGLWPGRGCESESLARVWNRLEECSPSSAALGLAWGNISTVASLPHRMQLEMRLPPNIGVDASQMGRFRNPTHMWHALIAVARGTARCLQPRRRYGWSGLSYLIEVCPAGGKGAREMLDLAAGIERNQGPSEVAASTLSITSV
jgi:hypothetical protein